MTELPTDPAKKEVKVPAGEAALEADPDVPVNQWVPEDPEIADVAFWGGLPVPEYAEPGDPADARIEKRKRRLLAMHDADHQTPLGEEALAVGAAGRALDGMIEQFQVTTDPAERYQLWQQMVDAAQAAPAEAPREQPPEEQPPKPSPPPPPSQPPPKPAA